MKAKILFTEDTPPISVSVVTTIVNTDYGHIEQHEYSNGKIVQIPHVLRSSPSIK